ncbi:UNVERIFIED_CONTAM: hypothetical protein K2H54_051086 [Gekko kuhli]
MGITQEFQNGDLDYSASATYFCKLDSEASDFPEALVREEWLSYRGVPKDQKEFHFRNPQLHQRANECIRGLKLIRNISSGKAAVNLLHTDFDLSSLKDSVDFSRVAVMGHSFGGATAILALVKEAQFKCAVALDAWMFPLENSLYPKVTKPVLFINTETFQTVDSVAKMKKICSMNNETKIITILGGEPAGGVSASLCPEPAEEPGILMDRGGTVHQSQTDFTFLAGNLLNRVFQTRGTINPHEGLDITNQAALAFLQKHLQLKEDFDQWDSLLEGVGNAVIPDGPRQKSSM